MLGPLLFLVYINDLQNASSLNIRLFADDTLLFHESKNISQSQNFIDDELSKVKLWLNVNKITINIAKTTYMLVQPQKLTNNVNTITLKIGDKISE